MPTEAPGGLCRERFWGHRPPFIITGTMRPSGMKVPEALFLSKKSRRVQGAAPGELVIRLNINERKPHAQRQPVETLRRGTGVATPGNW